MIKLRLKTLSLGLAGLVMILVPAVPALAMNNQNTPSSRPGEFTHHQRSSVSALGQATSTNWSGYAATGASNAFSSIKSSWIQPQVNCTIWKSAYSADWVGLDGYSNGSVEQIGTEANCINGVAQYYSWYEMYPQNPYEVITPSLSVAPGNNLTAAVTYNPGTTTIGRHGRRQTTPGSFTMTLTNATTGGSYTTTQTSYYTAQRSSAEVIAEAPYSGGILPLANFGTAGFTTATVNGTPLGSSGGLQSITMDDPYGMVATPSVFDQTNQNFTDTWSDPAI